MGEFETLNFSIGVIPTDIALFHAMYRTSAKGRRQIMDIMFSDYGSDAIQKIDSKYTSIVGEIFNVIFKSLGMEVSFVNEDEYIGVNDCEYVHEHILDDEVYMCTDYQFHVAQVALDIKEEILSDNIVMVSEILNNMVEEELVKRKLIKKSIDELGPALSKLIRK